MLQQLLELLQEPSCLLSSCLDKRLLDSPEMRGTPPCRSASSSRSTPRETTRAAAGESGGVGHIQRDLVLSCAIPALFWRRCEASGLLTGFATTIGEGLGRGSLLLPPLLQLCFRTDGSISAGETADDLAREYGSLVGLEAWKERECKVPARAPASLPNDRMSLIEEDAIVKAEGAEAEIS